MSLSVLRGGRRKETTESEREPLSPSTNFRRNRSPKSANDLRKIEENRCCRLNGNGEARIRTFPFSSDSSYAPSFAK